MRIIGLAIPALGAYRTRSVMHNHTLALLEFDKILSHLAFHCAFSGGAARAQALRPSPDPAVVNTWLSLTEEACAWLAHQPDPSFGGIADVTDLLTHAVRRSLLQPQALRDIHLLLDRIRILQRTFRKQADTYAGLAEMAGLLEPCPALSAEIARCIDERATVASAASPALARIRTTLRKEQDRLMRTLERMTANPDFAPYLQEALVTQRQGRYVVPVRAEHKGRLAGIVHDQSASGATLFVEPLAVVEHNNAIRLLELEEEKEIRRILTLLTEAVAEHVDALTRNLSVLGELDFTLAKARYAYAIKGIRPEMQVPAKPRPEDMPDRTDAGPDCHPGTRIWLRQARHPLLREDEAVPLDFELGPTRNPSGGAPCHVVVITGPNTGGKTVALKTVGLMVLMAQSGLLVPAGSGSRLSMFGNVYADIGDEQSIEQSLSTFSSHLTNIVSLLEEATETSLVLLDEVGAGTDPEEGAALATALLEHLRTRGVTTLASTHYSEIKLYAHSTPSVCNAAMEFDVESLRPTFRLTMGLPGRSNALTIARRLGLDETVVQQAETHVHVDASQANAMLEDIRLARQRAQALQDEARKERDLARLAKSELLYRLGQAEADRQAVLAETRTAMERLLEASRQELRALRKQVAVDIWDQARKEKLQTLESAQTRVDRIAGKQPGAASAPAAAVAEPVQGPIEKGDTVWIASLQATGRVVSEPRAGKRVEIQAGHMHFKARLQDLALRSKGAQDTASPQATVQFSRVPRTHTGLELDIRGARVDPGVAQVEQYLQEAYLGGMPWVRVIHGKGTGQLRAAVRDLMRRHPHVTDSRAGDASEGGEGVTIALFEYD